MLIATSITQSYLERSQPFFKSTVEYAHNVRRICFTIGFDTTIEGWECIETPLPECKWQPTNRESFHTLQHGEWVKYLSLPADEMVLFIDSDMILQRTLDLDFPLTDKVLVTQCSYPALNLWQVVKNLKCKKRADKFFEKYKCFAQREFCAAFILTSYKSWEVIYNKCYYMYDMLDNFTHHAAWQLLINTAISVNLDVRLLPPFVCNAQWYEGTEMKEGYVGEEQVYFNHTKFN